MVMVKIIMIISVISLAAWGIMRYTKANDFENHCKYYLDQASYADTKDKTAAELSKAIRYLEDNKMIEGYSSIFFESDEDDIGNWYSSVAGLYDITVNPPERGQLEIGYMSVNMKAIGLIENIPAGISIFPYNRLYFIWFSISLAGILASLIFLKINNVNKNLDKYENTPVLDE